MGSYRFTGSERANASRLQADVVTLTTEFQPRSADFPEQLGNAASYIENAFRETGARVSSQELYRNVIARFGPEHGPLTIIGAHYDAFGNTKDRTGADDNASGTAGLLELARLLGRADVETPVMLVAYANEEPPFFGSDEMGSAVHARSVSNVAGMICLDMIGYYSDQQTWPNWTFAALYPSSGDFIAVGGGWSDRRLAKHVKRAMKGAGMRVRSFTGPRVVADASDQRNYWQAGIPAVLVTDTAFLRNPNYHTRNDTAATLDYVRMARVVDGLYSAVVHTSH
jgi:Zn-dependent M28 family amino/carboxypeptidase